MGNDSPFRSMVIDALEEMNVKPTSRNVIILLGLLKDVLGVVEARAEFEGVVAPGRKDERGN